MDISQLMEEYRRKRGKELDLGGLLEIINPKHQIYTDTPGGNGTNTLWEQRYGLLNDPNKPDSNDMYRDLNDLYKRNPAAHREMQRRLLDNGLNQDKRHLAPYRSGGYKAITM